MNNELEGFFWGLRLAYFAAKSRDGRACEQVAEALRFRGEFPSQANNWLASRAAEGAVCTRLLADSARFWMPKYKLVNGRLEHV